MIAERERLEVRSTLQGDKVAMGIDDGAMAHIMQILTDLYSDPELAVVREYATNAYDAHIEVGQKRPIEVTTPSALAPFLVIQDWGVGLTGEDIHNIYSRYGASTKRNTNEQVGMLGLGCKSALTYAPQFTISSVKSGEKIAVAVSRDEDGAGSMTIVEQCSTTDENGTTITIPTQRDNDLQRKAQQFFAYWPEGSVLLDGDQPARIEGLKITENITLVEASGTSKIVMGNVAYPVRWESTHPDRVVPYGCSLVCRAPIGAVNFAPSREALMDTKTTKATLERLWAEFEAGKQDAARDAVSEAATAHDAVQVAGEWCSKLRVTIGTDLKWQGRRLPSMFELGRDDTGGTRTMMLSDNSAYNLGRAAVAQSIIVEVWPSTVWVTEFTPGTFAASHKRRLQAWLVDQSLPNVRQFVMLREGFDPPMDWIDPARVVDYETIRQIKLEGPPSPRNSYREANPPGSYDTYVDGEYVRAEGKDIAKTGHVFYHWGNKYQGRRMVQRLLPHFPSHTLVCLAANRINKFVRNMPRAVNAEEAITSAREKFYKNLTDQLDQEPGPRLNPRSRVTICDQVC